MKTYFKKLDSAMMPPPVDPDSIKGDLIFHYGNIRYFAVTDQSYVAAINQSFKIPPTQIFLVEGHGELNAHRDNGVHSCINYYLRPGGYKTSFWEPIENARRIKAKKYDKKTDTYIDVELAYVPEDIVLMDSFVAEDNDLYLLNIGEVHSVTGEKPKKPRAMVQLQWHHSTTVEDLIEKLKI
jgi:hypothetical protein